MPPPGGPTYPAPAAPPGNFVPASSSNAPTMFVSGPSHGTPVVSGQPAVPAFVRQPAQAATVFAPQPAATPPQPANLQPMMPQPMMPQPVQAPPMQQAPMQPATPPAMPIPRSQPPPYLASSTASRVGRPIEPWRDSLRQLMFLWGVALLAVFATPLATSPMMFSWDLIIDGEGTAKLPPLLLGAIGLLSAVVAAIPMQPAARGAIAAVLGLAGIIVPVALVGLPPWQQLLPAGAVLLLVPSLLVRAEYRDALLPRLLITIGVLASLVLYLLPTGDTIPLVGLFKLLVDAPGAQKVVPVLALAEFAIVLMALLAWLPSPTTGGAKLWAWLLILWALVSHVALLAVAGGALDKIQGAPNAALVAWIAGTSSPAGLAIGAAYLVLIGYGVASVVGKQLE